MVHAVLLLHLVLAGMPDPALAVFDGGQVRLSDVQREIRFLPLDEARFREELGMSEEKNWEDWIRRVALRRIAAQVAHQKGWLGEPEIAERCRAAQRKWWLGRWQESCYGYGFEQPSDQELEVLVEGRARVVPARLRLSHIFLRTRSPEETEVAVETLKREREELTSLDEFRARAKEISDSQSARRGGRLGYLRKGWLPERAEEVLFELPEGSISPPLPMKGGVHLFFVEKNEPARTLPLDREIAKLKAGMRKNQEGVCRQRRLAEAMGALPSTKTASEQVTAGSWSIARELFDRLYPAEGRPMDAMIQEYRERELLFQLGRKQADEDELRRMDDLAGNALVEELLRRLLPEFGEPDEATLRETYRQTQHGLKKRREMKLDVLSTGIPPGADPLEFYDSLAQLSSDLRGKRKTWEDGKPMIADGGAVERWPLLDDWELVQRLGPLVFEAIKTMEPGEISDPIQDEATLWIVRVEETVPARRMTFEEARDRLRRRWLRTKRNEASESIVRRLLEEHEFVLTDAGRERIGDAAVAQPTTQPSIPDRGDDD